MRALPSSRSRTRRSWLAATVVGPLVLCGPLLAHGGQYRGPGEVTAPTPGSGGSGSGSGTSTSASGPGGSAAGGAAAAGGASSSPAGPSAAGAPGRGPSRAAALDSDLSSWEFWWEFRKDPLLRLRDGLRARSRVTSGDAMLGRLGPDTAALTPPTDNDIDQLAVPALHRALGVATDRDTISGCLVALAKIGRDPEGARLHDVFKARLQSHDQEVRETAALCFGIARQGHDDDVDLLLSLALDRPEGRKACARTAVDERTRTFATYALGILLDRLQAGKQRAVVDAMLTLLDEPTGTHRNLVVAAIGALGQLPQTPISAAASALRDGAASGLIDYYEREMGPGEQLLQAHCPTVLANMLGRDHPFADRLRTRFAADLERTLVGAGGSGRARTNHHVAQSLALALGDLARPWASDQDADADIAELLLRCYHQHKDQQTRYFAILALGRQGGPLAREALLRELDRGTRSLEKPWIAVALANMVRDRAERSERAGLSAERDVQVGDAMLRVLADVKNPSAIGAVAIALGLSREDRASDPLRRMLLEYGEREDVGGQLAIGLALLDERSAAVHLRALLPRSVRQPQLLVQLTTALGRLGDGAVVDELLKLLGELDGGLARLSAVAAAIGQIGDRRCIAPLVDMLQDDRLTPLTRAFAAVALGGVCDPEPLPWNARYADALNYRAAVETLTDGAAGILDIL